MAARILIVEDERITAEDLSDILGELGYEVVPVVSSGAEAIAVVERSRPDLVLMDIRIKGELDGTETARILRERFDAPVVFLTAHSDDETLARAKQAEPLGYIVKPFQEGELHATIEMALHKDRADRERKTRSAWLAAAVDSSGEAVIGSDAAGVVTFMNPASERWTGWPRSEAVGRKLDEVVKLGNRNGGSASLPAARVLHGGMIAGLESGTVLIARDGAERTIGGTVAPVRDHTSRITGMVMVFGEEQRAAAPAAAGDSRAPLPPTVIAESESMRALMAFARRVAASEASTILLEGESGTGKDVLARFIHENSRLRSNAFLALNCAAIPETLLESELFGYEKGAFTDARSQKRGILELASGGTIFLDEVGELPLTLQAKMLRVLEEHSFRRLGGTKDVEVELRVIAATNRDLRRALEQGRFRLDLYYRLNVIQVTVPALRERPQDILPLANYFVGMYNRKFNRKVEGIRPDAVAALHAHDWPGNVRELKNAIERAMLMEEGEWLSTAALGMQAAPVEAAPPKQDFAAGDVSLAESEKTMLVWALEKTAWNQTRAAQLLKISRDALRYKIKKFKLKAPPAV